MIETLEQEKPRASRVGRVGLFLLALAAVAAPLLYFTGTTTAETNTPSVEFLPKLTTAQQKIVEALQSPTATDFVETPLMDVVYFWRDKHGIELHLDQKGINEAGVAADTPVTATLKNVPFNEALALVLDNLDLTAVMHGSVLLITSNERASAMLVTRTYPVADLVENKDYAGLVDTFTGTIQPSTWDEVGGAGTISVVPASKSLVISQTQAVHDEIAALLRSLRAARLLSSKGSH